MARPKYPSDHRRWFRVYEDILDDPKLATVELRDVGAFVVLLATLNRQKSRDGIAFISWRSAAALLRCQKRADVERVLSRLGAARVLTYSGSEAGSEYRIPKWSELQGFTPSTLRRDSDETPAPKTTPTPTPNKSREREQKPVADAPAKPTRSRLVKSLAPDDLDPAQKLALLAWVRAKHPAQEPRLRELVDACLDHHRSRGNAMADWLATCRTWIRRERVLAPRTSGPAAKQDERAELIGQNIQAAVRLSEAREQERARSRAAIAGAGANVRQLRASSDAIAD